MGGRIADLAMQEEDVEIGAVFEQEDNPMVGKDLGEVLGTRETGIKVSPELGKTMVKIDCLIDFTSPVATLENVRVCADKKIPIVIGTTGLDEKTESVIVKASKEIPVVYSPNMSIGVNLLFGLVREAAKVLGRDFFIKVDETHHVHKKDSPSGTAKMIAKIIKEACGKDVPIEAFREGEVVGNHGVVFDGEYERIEIRHEAKSRDVFVVGAIKAAKFVAGKKPGLYKMTDVLGLKGDK